MRKYFLTAFMLLAFCPFSLAEDTAEPEYLDTINLRGVQHEEIELFKNHDYINNHDYDFELNKDGKITPLNVHEYNDFNPYVTKSTSFAKEKKAGDFSFGTQQNYTFSPDSYTKTNTLYTKYQKDNFSFNTSYQNSGLPSLDQHKRGTLIFSPEYKLNEHFSLQNKMSNSFMDRSRKNEVVFSIKPFKDNRMNLDIGAGRVYSEMDMPTRSQLNFSTKFHF